MDNVYKIFLHRYFFLALQIIAITILSIVISHMENAAVSIDFYFVLAITMANIIAAIYLYLCYLIDAGKIKRIIFKNPKSNAAVSLGLDITKMTSWVSVCFAFICYCQYYLTINDQSIIYPAILFVTFVIVVFHFALALLKYKRSKNQFTIK